MWYTQTTTMIPKRLPKRYPSSKSYGKGKRFVRADLAPAVGYSREQMIDALRHFIGPFRSIDIEYYMNSLTPASSQAQSLAITVREWAEKNKILLGSHSEVSLADSLAIHGYGQLPAQPQTDFTLHNLLKEQDKMVASLAAQPRDPKVLVEALERIVEGFFGDNERKIASEALAEWKGGLNE
jgi:hypothetical protein